MGGLSTTFDVGGAISGGLGLIGNLIGSHSAYKHNKALMEQQNEYNVAMQNAQNEWNESMWNKYNEYNTPSNQVGRLREAGLNPYLAMSNGDTGNASSQAEGTQPQPAAEAPQSPWNTLGDSITTALANYRAMVQNDIMAGLFPSNKRKSEADADTAESGARVAAETADDVIEGVKEDTKTKKINNETLGLQNDANLANTWAEVSLKKLDGEAKELVNKWIPAEKFTQFWDSITSIGMKDQLTKESYMRTATGYMTAAQAAALFPYIKRAQAAAADAAEADASIKTDQAAKSYREELKDLWQFDQEWDAFVDSNGNNSVKPKDNPYYNGPIFGMPSLDDQIKTLENQGHYEEAKNLRKFYNAIEKGDDMDASFLLKLVIQAAKLFK